MPDLSHMFKRHQKYIFYLLSLAVLGWGFTPYKTLFLGFILGFSIGSYNHWLLVRRVKKFGEAVAENKKMYSLGTLTRMAGAVLATVIAVRYPEYFHLPSVIFGLVTMYVVIMIDYAYLQVFKKSQP